MKNEQERLANRFESYRTHLQAAAYRMLGSLSEAEDAVQETWFRLRRSDPNGIENLGGWLTAVVSRVCLDMLRSRRTRREDPMESKLTETLASRESTGDPEREALLAEEVGVALMVVLDRLRPAERVAFVLHDIFAMSFAEIAAVVGTTEAATRQLASRSRRRIRGAEMSRGADLSGRRELVSAFLAAARAGDFESLLAMLDPDVALRDDRGIGGPRETRGAAALARQVSGKAQSAQAALVDGEIGAIAAPRGRLLYVLRFMIRKGKIAEVDLISDVERIRALRLAVF
jgi:RNA polymerase sigma-70 factor (ECF subfamily)